MNLTHEHTVFPQHLQFQCVHSTFIPHFLWFSLPVDYAPTPGCFSHPSSGKVKQRPDGAMLPQALAWHQAPT